MNPVLQVILEILRYTIPALIVFLTVYFILKQFFQRQQQMKALDLQKINRKETVSIRLQAYERLTLFLERIEIPAMLMRIRQGGMNAPELRDTLLVTIQKEYEHNLSQQLYVSEKLWEIIRLTRSELAGRISEIAASTGELSDASELADKLISFNSEWKENPLPKARQAVRTEAGLLL
jgi:hypothetical protein